MLNSLLDQVFEVYLYNFYKNTVKLILLIKIAAKIKKNYYI